MSKLTVTLPDDLHAQIRQELEEQGITTGQFIEMVVTKYFTKDKKGENNMATRTIAFQVSEELYAGQTGVWCGMAGAQQQRFRRPPVPPQGVSCRIS